MVKRIVAAYLWICACWSVGAWLQDSIGVSEHAGLIVGVVLGAALLILPRRVWTQRLRIAFGTGTADPTPAPLAQTL